MTPPSNWPQSCKRAKEDQKAKKQIENNNISAQVCTITNTAVTILETTTIIQD